MRKAILASAIALAAAAALAVMTYCTPGQAFAAGAVLAVVALPLMALSRVQLGKAFSVAPKASVLVTRGVYSKVPHPLYAFLDAALLGAVIALRRPWLVAAWLALVAVHAWAARRESKVLEAAFGDAYREYRAKTWW
jgi:protein-S-isoprenylcysteine O-methyltransferase Ste14